MNIHPTAVVDPGAKIADSSRVGPFCFIGNHVEVGEECELISHVVVSGPTRIGGKNRIFPFTSIGMDPQDLKFGGEPTRLEMGDNNTIRENVTIHRGTVGGGGVTTVGSHCLLMAYAHIAHDCHVGDHVIMANNATLAGHVTVEDYAIVGALSAVHQFCTVGAYAYIGGGSITTQDVLPFSRISAVREVHAYGINSVGLERKGFSKERLQKLRQAFRTLLSSKLNTSQAVERLKAEPEASSDVQSLLRFIEKSERGFIK